MIINAQTIPHLKYDELQEAEKFLLAECARLLAYPARRPELLLSRDLRRRVKREIEARDNAALGALPIQQVLLMAGVAFHEWQPGLFGPRRIILD